MTSPRIRVKIDPPVARVTLDHPPVNVLDVPTIRELDDALERITRDGLPFVVLTSARDDLFSAGVEVRDHFPDRIDTMLETFHGLCKRVLELDTISIACVSGGAFGGAMELLSCFDFVVASTDVVFAQPEIDLACFPPFGATIYPSMMGPHRANAVVLLGDELTAHDAERVGLVYRVVPKHELEQAGEELLARLQAKSPAALRIAKRALRIARAESTKALERVETLYREELARTSDMVEA